MQFITPNIFLDEFTEFLEMLSVSVDNFVLSGDTNFHLDTNERNAAHLKDSFMMFDMVQYVDFPTHNLGYTLDLVLTRSDSPAINDLAPNNVHLTDHFMINFKIRVSSPK